MLFALERRLLFPGSSSGCSWETPPPSIRAQDVFWALSRGVLAHAWWCPTADWKPEQGAVLFCHGYKGTVSTCTDEVRRCQERMGKGVLIFDYPGYGRSTGKPDEAGCHAAGDAAFDWLVREKGVAPERIILYGRSLGGGVAIELATRRPYHALVLVGTFTSVPDVAARRYPWLLVRRWIRNRFENLKKIGRTQGRVLIAHGTADRFIPFVQGERLFAAAPAPSRFLPLVGCEHHHSPGPVFDSAVHEFLQAVVPHRTRGPTSA